MAFGDDQAAIEIQMKHRSGVPIWTGERKEVGPEELKLDTAVNPRLLVEVDGETQIDEVYVQKGSTELMAYAYEMLYTTPGEHHIRVTLTDQADQATPEVVFDSNITLQPRQILPIAIRDARITGGNPERGRDIFFASSIGQSAGCRVCHSIKPGERKVGPSLAGIATRAATRVPGMSAEEYIRQSIEDPGAYIVEGFPNAMLPDMAEKLSDQQMEDLIAFLMTLK
jgi:cytochrome c2